MKRRPLSVVGGPDRVTIPVNAPSQIVIHDDEPTVTIHTRDPFGDRVTYHVEFGSPAVLADFCSAVLRLLVNRAVCLAQEVGMLRQITGWLRDVKET